MKSGTRRFWLLLASGFFACQVLAGEAKLLEVFVSPTGSDAADGLSRQTAVQTLQRAIDGGVGASIGDRRTVAIRIADGKYLGQRVKLASLPEGVQLSIAADGRGARPTFDGDGKGGTWLSIQPKESSIGNITVSGLEVTRYSTAIALQGSRDDERLSVTNIALLDNTFRTIGQIADLDSKPSTAAVRLINAHGVRIEGNRFIEIRNRQRCGLLHSIYAAHNSTGNIITNNSFEDACGDAIRFRDRSGGNEVSGNRFVDAWAKSPITDWYCDASGREDCTKESGECPSFGNKIGGNQIVAKRSKKPVSDRETFGPDQTSLCPLPSNERRRFVPR